MTRCTTRPRCALSVAVLLAAAAALPFCGTARVAATDAVKRAEAAGEELREMKIAEQTRLSYRLHLRQAKDALEKRKYKKARQEALLAVTAANSAMERKKILVDNVNTRMKECWRIAEHDPFPPKSLVESCFAAREAVEKNDYDEAAAILQEARKRLAMQTRITPITEVIIQAPDEYYEHRKFIPLYKDMGESGPGEEVVARITQAARARFVESKWLSPNSRYVKVLVNVKGGRMQGWVEGRFVY